MGVIAQAITQAVEQTSTQATSSIDQAALIVSIISLVISLFTGIGIAIYEVHSSKKLNDISIEASYFNDIYREYLLTELPKHRKNITIDSQGKLVGTDDLLNGLKSIRGNSLYYFYTDKTFYDKLKECVQDLEDFILDTENQTLTAVDQAGIFSNIEEKIKAIYEIMIQKCFNGRIR